MGEIEAGPRRTWMRKSRPTKRLRVECLRLGLRLALGVLGLRLKLGLMLAEGVDGL